MSIRVVIADDHPVVRDGLRLTIERSGHDIEIVGEASDGMEVLELAGTTPADVWLLDITMSNMNGIEAARELLRRIPDARVIMLSLHNSKTLVEAALASGVHGYLTKETATRHVVEALTEVHVGHYYLCPTAAKGAVLAGLAGKDASRRRGAGPVELTGQERKVLQLIAEGHSTKEIASKLALAVNTAHAHRNNLMAKLGIHKQADLVRYALKEGLAEP